MNAQPQIATILAVALTNAPIDASLFDGMSETDWTDLRLYAAQQGVTAIAFSGLEKAHIKPHIDPFMDWLGQLELIKSGYQSHLFGVRQMAELCKEADADMLVLKGLSLTEYYPAPESREFGDLDIFVMPEETDINLDWGETLNSFKATHDKVNKLAESKGIKVEYWDKHDVFNYNGTHVEHHSYFVSNNSKVDKRINDELLSIVAQKKGVQVDENVYYPTPDFNALFILNHTIGHMSYEGATLRNVLDYGLFLMKDGDKVHWNKVTPVLKETRWVAGFNTLVRVAEKVMKVDLSRFYIGVPDEKLADRVLNTILNTTLHQESNLPLVKRVVKKTQRLFSHRWMYSTGLIPANFWTDCVWGSLKEHLERPEQF